MLADIPEVNVVFFGFVLLLAFVGLFLFFIYAAWQRQHGVGVSPYTGLPLRRCEDLPYESKKRVLQYLYDFHEYDNRIFEMKKAAFCRETGRIFPNTVNWFGTIHVDWNFLNKRYSGHLVSWGSLPPDQQMLIRDAHFSMEGFQTEISSPQPFPRDVEAEYAFTRPGPLYVDTVTRVLVGWKQVPETSFEVLIIQHPTQQL